MSWRRRQDERRRRGLPPDDVTQAGPSLTVADLVRLDPDGVFRERAPVVADREVRR